MHQLTAAVDAEIPSHIPAGGKPWDYHGPAMIARMIDTVESIAALMTADRAVDGAALVRVLYEHTVKFCWVSIDPKTNYARWQSDSAWYEAKLTNDAIDIGLIDEERVSLDGIQTLSDVASLAVAVDKHWSQRLPAFTAPTKGSGALMTLRGLYLPAYRTGSEAVHGRPSVLDAYTSRGSQYWRMGDDAASTSLFWPLVVPLFAWPLLVCHAQWGWPDPDVVIAANNSMYGV